MPDAPQTTPANKITSTLREAVAVVKGEADTPARLGVTHLPTGHRVEITGDFRSIEIVRQLIFNAVGAKEVRRGRFE